MCYGNQSIKGKYHLNVTCNLVKVKYWVNFYICNFTGYIGHILQFLALTNVPAQTHLTRPVSHFNWKCSAGNNDREKYKHPPW